MPPGAKKRKALKKKKQQQQQESIGASTNTNGDNLNEKGNEEDGGSQDDRESDDSNLSSPASQGNEQFGVASQDPCVNENAPVADSVSKVAISVKSEHPETSNCDEKKEYPSTGLEKGNGVVATLPESAAITSRKVESSEVPVFSEEKRPLVPGPPAVRTSWLSCCGLFDAVTGSDR